MTLIPKETLVQEWMATLGTTHSIAHLGHSLEYRGPSGIDVDTVEVHRTKHRHSFEIRNELEADRSWHLSNTLKFSILVLWDFHTMSFHHGHPQLFPDPRNLPCSPKFVAMLFCFVLNPPRSIRATHPLPFWNIDAQRHLHGRAASSTDSKPSPV